MTHLSLSKSEADKARVRCLLLEYLLAHEVKFTDQVTQHSEKLRQTIEIYRHIEQIISTSKSRCRTVKEKLIACKCLLQCNLDSLRKLWRESLLHKEAHTMLEEIENLVKAPEETAKYMMETKFLEATNLVTSSINLLDKDLSSADGLKNLRSEMIDLREKLLSLLLQELHKELYMSPTDVFFLCYEGREKTLTYGEVFTQASPHVQRNQEEISRNFETILKCISKLKRLPEIIDIVKEKYQEELAGIVKKSSKFIYNVLQNTTDIPVLELPLKDQRRFLLDLTEALLTQFKQVAFNQKYFITELQNYCSTGNLNEQSYYQMADIYSNMQTIVEDFVDDYLFLDSTPGHHGFIQSNFDKTQNMTDISSFFLPKKSEECENWLFKFENSSYSMNMLQETRDRKQTKTNKSSLICIPAANNISIIYKPMKKFVLEIESALNFDVDTWCPLHNFLVNSVNLMLEDIKTDINRTMDEVGISLQNWNSETDLKTLKGFAVEVPVLESTLILYKRLRELEKIMDLLPDFSYFFLGIICNLFLDYKNLCSKAFKIMFSDDQNVFSISWAMDRDIRRLFKNYPNWKSLVVDELSEVPGSSEEFCLRSIEESDLLVRNLSSSDLSPWEIIRNDIILRNLGLMHESMQWLSMVLNNFLNRILEIPRSSLSQTLHGTGKDKDLAIDNISGVTECLTKLVKGYEELADVCILALHLEARARCFYYLFPLKEDRKSILQHKSEDLRDNLLKMDEILVSFLLPKKFQYVFVGLGELISSILMSSVTSMSGMGEQILKKIQHDIIILQQCLASITLSREIALNKARHYFDLFYNSVDEILNTIVEHGPRFQEHEYVAVIKVLCNTEEEDESRNLDYYLKKLGKYFSNSEINN